MRRTSVTEGIVIRRLALPSGDVVATLLSEHGKWRGVARKGKIPGGNLGRLSLFHDVTVQFYRRREDDLALLTQVRLNGALPNLSRPDVYPYAHVLAELTDALTVDVHLGEKVHAYLASGLRGLNRHDDPDLAIAWPVPNHQLVLSDKDRRLPWFRDLPQVFTYARDVRPPRGPEGRTA